jgi:hypothetical protein
MPDLLFLYLIHEPRLRLAIIIRPALQLNLASPVYFARPYFAFLIQTFVNGGTNLSNPHVPPYTSVRDNLELVHLILLSVI